MGIIIIAGALLGVVGLVGLVCALAIPGWRPRGPNKGGAIGRILAFAICLAIGAGVLVYGALSTTTITG
ncbi:hypothetical protein [Luethyella okanaganae]|uniref:DUF4190 domain-containing protein n=1 Tax=Luethyella okanaganae TaxID=69372 RepID=A0ABW1VBU1_9MICO